MSIHDSRRVEIFLSSNFCIVSACPKATITELYRIALPIRRRLWLSFRTFICGKSPRRSRYLAAACVVQIAYHRFYELLNSTAAECLSSVIEARRHIRLENNLLRIMPDCIGYTHGMLTKEPAVVSISNLLVVIIPLHRSSQPSSGGS